MTGQRNGAGDAPGRTVIVGVPDVERVTRAAMEASGCDPANAAAIAWTVTAAERDGCAAHGLFRVPGYAAGLRSGRVDGRTAPVVERIAPAVVTVDARGGYAPLALQKGRQEHVDAARDNGVAVMAVRNCYHYAALWPEVEALCDAGMVAMASTSYLPVLAPAGGTEPLFGTNPLAFGWPRPDHPPMVFDFATAAMARGSIRIAARDGEPVPSGVGLGPDGEATTDPSKVLEGVQLPFGGYKGSAVALMVELMAAALIGDRFGFEALAAGERVGEPAIGGEFLLAIDPDRTAGPGWREHGEQLYARMASQAGVRLPGDRRLAARRRSEQDGVAVDRTLWDEVTGLAG
jgi:delta1-piperideine-2-carboxylate reductase